MKKVLAFLFFVALGAQNISWQQLRMPAVNVEVAEQANRLNGGYILMNPLDYAPNDTTLPCSDIYGNSVQNPVSVPTGQGFGYGTSNQTLNNRNTVLHGGAGGSGYSIGDKGTIAGGSPLAQYQVTAVSGGAVTGFNVIAPGGGYTIGTATTGIATSHTTGSGTGFEVDLVSYVVLMYVTASPLPFASGACVGTTPLPQNNLYDLAVNVPLGSTQGLFAAVDSFAAFECYAEGTATVTRGCGMTAANFYPGTQVPVGTYLQNLQSQGTLNASGTTNWNSTLNAGGSGYAANDLGTVGGCTTAPTYQVLTVSGGVVTSYEILTSGSGCTIPSTAVATTRTTGSGTGFKINFTGLTAGIFLGGSINWGHSFGAPTSGTYFQNSPNPLPQYLTVQEGASYFEESSLTFQGYNGTSWLTFATTPGSGAAGEVPYVNSGGGFSYSTGFQFNVSDFGLTVGTSSVPGIINVGTGTKTGGSPTCPTSSPPETFQNSDSSWYADCIGDIAGQTLTIGLTSGEAAFAVPLMVDSTAGSLFEVDSTSARPGMVGLVNANSTTSNGACVSGIDGYTSGSTNSVSGELCITFTDRTNHYGRIDFYTRDSGGINDRANISDTFLTLNPGMGLVIDTSYSINSSGVGTLHGLSVDGTAGNSIQVTGIQGGVTADNFVLGDSGSGSNSLSWVNTASAPGTPGTGTATMYLNAAGTELLLAIAGQNSGSYGQVCTSINGACSGGGGGVTSITGTAHEIIASASTGAVTLSTPQGIDTSSTPSFAGMTMTGDLVTGTTGCCNMGNSSHYWLTTYTDYLVVANTVIASGQVSGPDLDCTNTGTSLCVKSDSGTFSINGAGVFAGQGVGIGPLSGGYSSLPTCNSGEQGYMYTITNSNTSTFGANITGTGSNIGIAFCNGTNWTYR